MGKRIVLTGKMGPTFGDRNSWISVNALDVMGSPDGEDCVITASVTNWPLNDRADSMRAVFDTLGRSGAEW